ncbi:hypothetical protein MNBD_ACTINO01-2468 [hydrothermal vent metagenome]|uniref:Uncharacterized protein n=1 Tax=hydrothermal vent metagenome TaxID=652676 RepID=A0A3B0SFS0_9ZZZZ
MTDKIEIMGGAGPQEAAAIAAVIARIEADELAATAVRPHPIHKSQWVQASRPMEHLAPVPPEEYDKQPESASANPVGP